MTAARQSLGRTAERLVATELQRRGWRIVARNARVPDLRGEIDLIAVDGDVLVFVEVKARRADSWEGPETPAMAVGHRKRMKLRSLAAAWLGDSRSPRPPTRDLRFDVVGLRLDGAGRVVEWDHVRGAF